MTAEALLFFQDHPERIPLYAAFDEALERRLGPQAPRIQKTQITYVNPRVFACVSLPRKMGEKGFLLSLGLGYRLVSPRVSVATEPYPGRWTCHIPIHDFKELDDELMGWIVQAYQFALAKKR